MNNISDMNKDNCTGCRMCEKVCPTHAIFMNENEEGFIEPVINVEKCINCGLCYKKCPQLNEIKCHRLENVEVFAAKNKNLDEQKNSSSGGIFSVIANYVLEKNGIVYGCAFNNDLVAEHIRIDQKLNLYKLRGSKYVQSNTLNTFCEVKADLEENKIVLYSGTPCQIAGLKNYLGHDYENLITVDLVCHGVPSPKLFKKYKQWLEEKYKNKVVNYEFRNKEKSGWGLNSKVQFENGINKYFKFKLDPYYKSFIEASVYRNVCYSCKYSQLNRISDITLLDFWGVEKQYPEFFDYNGVSAILINTKIGKDILLNVQDSIELLEIELDKVTIRNENLIHPSIKPEIRKEIYIDIEKKNFETYIKENLKFKKEFKEIVKLLIPQKIKNYIKKV